MTLEEIIATIPEGFHDAILDQLSIDYEASTITMRVNLCLGLPHEENPARNRRGKAALLLRGMQYCVVEKPEDNGHGLPSHFHATMKDFPTRPDMADAVPGLENGHFAHSFFIFGWNCCIHIAAQSAELTFDDPEDQAHADVQMKSLHQRREGMSTAGSSRS